MKNNTIFVSIASYKDPLLVNTLDNIYKYADNPEQIRTVVFNQTDFKVNNDHLIYSDERNIEIYSVDFRNTRGVSWARNKIQSFIDNEKYYLQIDAHMEFAQGWDTNLKKWLNECNAHKPAISFYPPAFDLERGRQGGGPVKNEPRALNMKAVTSIGIGLDKGLCDKDNGDDKPIPGTTFAAGFLFASIDYPKEIPYDPLLYWNYEETDQTLRAFTNGWTFFGTPEQVIWHKYNINTSPDHFKEAKDGVGLENRSNEHAEYKYFSGEYSGKYGLGTQRTLKEFELLNNIDFEKGLLNKRPNKDMLIVVPYRDREEHLKKYLDVVPKYFDTQDLTYDILITELDPIGDWNAGLVCNSLINFIKKTEYKYLYIHHVDVYPISGNWVFPEDGEVLTFLGDAGSCLTTLDNFLKVGGYRNSFWGWGAEDDDLYKKLFYQNIRVTNLKDTPDHPFKVQFDTEFQSHHREFVGKNYSGNAELLKTPPNRNYNSIFDTNKYGVTHSLEQLGENIYRQKVKPLHKSYRETDVKNLVLGVTYDLKVDEALPFYKSGALAGPGKFDILTIDLSTHPNPEFVKESQAYGGKLKQETIEPGIDPFIERFVKYREVILDSKYEYFILSDIWDVYFQDNPFKYIETVPKDEVIFASEGIIFNDSTWNRNVFNSIYNEELFNHIKDYEVLCCGVIAGHREGLLDFIDKFLKEVDRVWSRESKNVRGADQPIINKLLYLDQSIKRHTYRIDSNYCIHLDPIFKQPDKCRFTHQVNITGAGVMNNNTNDYFSIVHQYNRDQDFFYKIYRHYNVHFSLINA